MLQISNLWISGHMEAIFCAENTEDGMLGVAHKSCEHKGCSTIPSYGLKGTRKREFCLKHNVEGMASVLPLDRCQKQTNDPPITAPDTQCASDELEGNGGASADFGAAGNIHERESWGCCRRSRVHTTEERRHAYYTQPCYPGLSVLWENMRYGEARRQSPALNACIPRTNTNICKWV